MLKLRAPWALLFVCPILLSQLTACDAPPPSFIETPAEGPMGSYSGDASKIPGSSDQDPDRNDLNPADRGEADDGPLNPQARWSFQASQIEKTSLTLDMAGGQIQQKFTMDSNLIAQNLSFTQISRPVSTESFAQGSTQEQKLESFTQNSNPSGLLDILLVVDNSGSMKEEQANLSTKLMPLLSYVQDSDWRIGVVTTDPSEGCLRGMIRKGDAQASNLFANAVNAGTNGSGNERGIQQAVAGLKGECQASGSWVRNQSTLAVLIVSDEDNCSDGQGCGQDPWAKSDYLQSYMSSIRQVGTNARVYGLIWHPSQSQSSCRTGYNPAYNYAELIQQTGGTWGSICDTDYTKTLQAISKDLSVILKTQFALQFAPSAGTVKVFVNGLLQTAGYQIRGNVIEFAQAPEAGANIQIQYNFVTQPPKKSFALSQEPDPTSIQVYLDGSQTNAYSYDRNTKSVEFTQAPNVREVRVVYRRPGELKREFSIGSQVKSGSIEVKINQQSLATSAYTYSTSSGLLTLNQAPTDQASIEVRFTQETAPRLRYPIYATEAQKAQIRIYDAQSGASLSAQIEQDEIVFSPAQFRALRPIVVRYPIQGQDVRVIELPEDSLVDSVQVRGSRSGICEAASLADFRLDMSGCSFARDEAIEIQYAYAKQHQTSFDLGQLDLDLQKYRWIVRVNGRETKDYTIQDRTLDFVSLPLQAQIEVFLVLR